MSENHSIQAQGASIEVAIQAGLAKLQVERTEVSIEIIDEGARGILGVGKRNAIVRLTKFDQEPTPETVAPIIEPEPEIDPIVEDPAPVKQAPSAPVIDVVKTENAPSEAPKKPRKERKPRPEKQAPKPRPEKKQRSVKELVADESTAVSPEQLQKELDTAEELIGELLGLMGIETTITTELSEKENANGWLSLLRLDGGELSSLIGPRGKVLNEFQFLIRMIVSHKIADKTHFSIDMDEYRTKRYETLVQLAQKTADKVIDFKRPISLDPMPPHERRIIHMTLRGDKRIVTQSKGEGDRRRVRVIPKGARSGGNKRRSNNNDRRRSGGNGRSNNRNNNNRSRNNTQSSPSEE